MNRGRRVRRPRAGGVVAAARRQRAADHVDVRRDVLQRVVGLREQREVRGRRGVRAVGAELRQPEQVQVRLVADDHVADGGERARDRRRVGGELRPRRRRRRGHAAERVDGDDRPDPVGRGCDRRPLERGELRCRRRLERRRPDGAEHDRAVARLPGEQHLGVGRAALGGVLDRADDERVGRLARAGRSRQPISGERERRAAMRAARVVISPQLLPAPAVPG